MKKLPSITALFKQREFYIGVVVGLFAAGSITAILFGSFYAKSNLNVVLKKDTIELGEKIELETLFAFDTQEVSQIAVEDAENFPINQSGQHEITVRIIGVNGWERKQDQVYELTSGDIITLKGKITGVSELGYDLRIYKMP